MDNTEITDAQLLAYLDGETDNDTTRIIEQTARYRQRAAALAQLQETLAANLAADAPSPLDVTQYQLGLLPPDEAAAVAGYLADHPHAARELEILEVFLKRWEPSSRPRFSPIQAAKIWIAQLLTSSGGGLRPALAGVRGEVEHIYQADDVQIVLDIDDDPDRPQHKTLAGLVINQPADSATARVWSTAKPDRDWETAVDDDGTFIFAALPQDSYTLLIRAGSVEIYIESLTL